MDLVQYVNKLNSDYQSYYSQWETLQNQLDTQKQNRLSATPAANGGQHEYTQVTALQEARTAAEVEQIKADIAETQQQLEDLSSEAIADFEDVEKEFKAAINDFLTVKPADVDTSASILLSSGSLSDKDLCDMTVQYAENSTMLTLIANEAAKRDTYICKTLLSIITTFKTTNERNNVFDGAVLTVSRGINPGKSLAEINHNYWETEKLNEVTNDITRLQSLNADTITDLGQGFLVD